MSDPSSQSSLGSAAGLAESLDLIRSRLGKLGTGGTRRYLIRSTTHSAARALGGMRVEMNAASRTALHKRMREFRADTGSEVAEIKRWLKDKQAKGTRAAAGLIAAGMLAELSEADAQALRGAVPNIQLIVERPLPLIRPMLGIANPSALNASQAWHLEAIGQAGARRNGKAYTGQGVRVAVMDTGVQTDHPELQGKVLSTWRVDSAGKAIDHRDVIVDAQHADTDGHGTHVAGLIAGATVGVAPDARLDSLLMMPGGFATTHDFVRCLDWAAEHLDVQLVNFSAGIDPYADDMMPFVADLVRLGCMPFFAVGNDGENRSCSPGNYIDGISVGSVDPTEGKQVSAFSGSGQMLVDHVMYDVPDLVAPGAQVRSCVPTDAYAELNGTSMATPVACGVAACVLEREGGLMSAAELMAELRRLCVALPAEPKSRQGRGLIQVPVKP